jgi:diguanylate cyclase (GGDEF)-like protein
MTQRPTPPQVLVLEDDQDASDLITETVNDHFGGRCATPVRLVGELSNIDIAGVDIVLCDYNLPDGTALDALRILHERRDDLPVIVVTGERQVGTAIEAIRAGAADYLIKFTDYLRTIPVALEKNLEVARVRRENERLHNALASSLAQLKRKNTELEEAAAKFEQLASTDQLTGLANRRRLEQRLREMFIESQRYDTDLSCLMIDLDGFKLINDTLGHQKGDDLLGLTGRIIEEQIRDCDIGGRYGGDEFVIALPQTSHETAVALAQRLIAEFRRQSELLEIRGRRCGMSIGVASRRLSAPQTPVELVSQADRALYQAKLSGRSRIHICGPDGQSTISPESRAA